MKPNDATPCRNCLNALRHRDGYVTACGLPAEQPAQRYARPVSAAINGECPEYAPKDAQKRP